MFNGGNYETKIQNSHSLPVCALKIRSELKVLQPDS